MTAMITTNIDVFLTNNCFDCKNFVIAAPGEIYCRIHQKWLVPGKNKNCYEYGLYEIGTCVENMSQYTKSHIVKHNLGVIEILL